MHAVQPQLCVPVLALWYFCHAPLGLLTSGQGQSCRAEHVSPWKALVLLPIMQASGYAWEHCSKWGTIMTACCILCAGVPALPAAALHA